MLCGKLRSRSGRGLLAGLELARLRNRLEMNVYFSVTEVAALSNTVNLEIRNQFGDASVTNSAPLFSDDRPSQFLAQEVYVMSSVVQGFVSVQT
jgi:hypothetical protein